MSIKSASISFKLERSINQSINENNQFVNRQVDCLENLSTKKVKCIQEQPINLNRSQSFNSISSGYQLITCSRSVIFYKISVCLYWGNRFTLTFILTLTYTSKSTHTCVEKLEILHATHCNNFL